METLRQCQSRGLPPVKISVCKAHMDAWKFDGYNVVDRYVSKCVVCGRLTSFVVKYDSPADIPMTLLKYMNY